MPYVRRIKKAAKKGYKKFVRPYVKRKGGYNNRMKLYKEISAIKKMVNAEKKMKEFALGGQAVGQLSNASDGALCFSITPLITQGTGYDNRTGRSIKCSGLYLRGLVQQQANTTNRMNFNVTIVTVQGQPQSTAQILSGMFNTDPITGVRQYNCPRNPDNYTDYRILSSRNYFLEADYLGTQLSQTNVYMPLKLSHHIRYANNSNTIEEGEIFIIIRCDRGDSGSPATGGWMAVSARLSYFDN